MPRITVNYIFLMSLSAYLQNPTLAVAPHPEEVEYAKNLDADPGKKKRVTWAEDDKLESVKEFNPSPKKELIQLNSDLPNQKIINQHQTSDDIAFFIQDLSMSEDLMRVTFAVHKSLANYLKRIGMYIRDEYNLASTGICFLKSTNIFEDEQWPDYTLLQATISNFTLQEAAFFIQYRPPYSNEGIRLWLNKDFTSMHNFNFFGFLEEEEFISDLSLNTDYEKDPNQDHPIYEAKKIIQNAYALGTDETKPQLLGKRTIDRIKTAQIKANFASSRRDKNRNSI